ncbi:MAG: DNA topoisomerase 1 [Porticoccaceae bacterium]|nr:MAG: DNA topoisomerase 1 [Porticoccaceae bacterium]
MGKSLVIVESPAKAKTIGKYLGPGYVVKSSIGHIRDLPAGGGRRAGGRRRAGAPEAADPASRQRRKLIERMGVDPEHGWKARYEILPGKEKVVAELRKLAQEADAVYLATDLDREGEAIAWHLREAIGGDPAHFKRVVFNEITRRAIAEAFAHPGDIDLNRVNAQQARRFLDRVVGFMVSPLLWEKVARGLSAGRVQSVAVRLIVEREREIRSFVPEEYWTLHAATATERGEPLLLEVKKKGEAAFRPRSREETEAAMAELAAGEWVVSGREDTPTSARPPAPFITSTLQQAASTRLGFGVKKTMTLAQRLYEAGYITYMRTDSTNLSEEAVAACREWIRDRFGDAYLPERPPRYASREGAQEAHEAIRPVDVALSPEEIKGLDGDARRLYQLIWQQFVACQMAPARFTTTTITVVKGDYELRARGRVVRFDGFLRVLPPVRRGEEDQELPDVAVGEPLVLEELRPRQHFTKPPPRYTEASLVRELEKRGIGRPSTYAAIISTIQERGYVRLVNRRFHAAKIGDIVTERLMENFSDLMDYGFTAAMEAYLDEIARGEADWREVLDRFYRDFVAKLERAQAEEGGMRPNLPTPTEIPCPSCGRPMMIRVGSTGVFLGCSGYELPPKERCKTTLNLIPGEEAVNLDEDDEAESRLLLHRRRCGLCGATMEPYLIDERRRLHICGNHPDCPGHELEEGNFRLAGYDGPTLTCDRCGAEMRLKSGRFGKYFACTAEGCGNTRKLLRNGRPAPPKMDPVPLPELRCEKVDDHYVLRDGAAGLFLAASQFPRHRETRAPLVRELKPHRAQIPAKYHYLLDAPEVDDQGNPTVIRYSRKTGESYVQSEVDGKPTGWRAHWRDGRWQVVDRRRR